MQEKWWYQTQVKYYSRWWIHQARMHKTLWKTCQLRQSQITDKPYMQQLRQHKDYLETQTIGKTSANHHQPQSAASLTNPPLHLKLHSHSYQPPLHLALSNAQVCVSVTGREREPARASNSLRLVPTVGLQPQPAATATSAPRQLSPAHSTPALHQWACSLSPQPRQRHVSFFIPDLTISERVLL